jgi:hypothetical protein
MPTAGAVFFGFDMANLMRVARTGAAVRDV